MNVAGQPHNSPERLRQIDEAFAQALDLDPTERPELLDDLGANDPTLRYEVEELLAQADRQDSLLRSGGAADRGILETLQPGGVERPEPGSRIGRYRTLRELGRGGMGVVYLAERADGAYRQQVALKLVALGASSDALHRFSRERQILAWLEHPNIARLLDGGISEQGSPYLVVEYVEGLPIDRYCAEHELSIEERLGLLDAVCRAVESAHRRLVIHRDIKPSNILVTPNGTVKLLDFGIAKLLEDDSGPSTADAFVTMTGARAMTPQYASPEQFCGQPVTVASDVYQIGLLAFELLAGQRPYELSDRLPSEAERLICELEPPRPSRIAQGNDDPSIQARGRKLAPDLDAIVLRALRKEPEHRYGSVDRLREDFERYSAGKPVAARRGTAGYRLSKFLRRNALAVTATAAVALGVLILATLFTWRLARERDQTREAAAEARTAQARAESSRLESEKIVEFLEGLFQASDPMKVNAEGVTAREILDRGAERIDQELDEQPAVRARLMSTIGGLYERLGLLDRAEDLLEQSLLIQEQAGVGANPTMSQTLVRLGYLYFRAGRWHEAEPLLERAVVMSGELLEAGDSEQLAVRRISALNALAGLKTDLGKTDEASALYADTLALTEATHGPDASRTADILNNIANLEVILGQYDQARRRFERAIAIAEKTQPPNSVARMLGNLGLLEVSAGNYATAAPLFERGLELVQQDADVDMVIVANVHINLGMTYQRIDRTAEAEASLRTAERIHLERFDESHPSLALIYGNYGELRNRQGRPTEALAYFARSLKIAEATYGPRNMQTAILRNNYGEAYLALDRLDPAEAQFLLARSIAEEQVGADNLTTSWPLLNLARVYQRRGQPERAEPLFQAALDIRRREQAPEVEERRDAASGFAAFLRAQGRDDEALAIELEHDLEHHGEELEESLAQR